MTNKFVRVDDDDHATIMKLADSHNKSGADVVSWLLRKVEGNGIPEIKINRKRSKAYCDPKYPVPASIMREIPVKISPPKKEGVEIAIKCLADGVEEHDSKGYWLSAIDTTARTVAYLAGASGDIRFLRMAVMPFMRDIKEFSLAVSEESLDVFIPANVEAQNILHIIGAGAEECYEKEYFTACDLFLLWTSGFEIHYMETI